MNNGYYSLSFYYVLGNVVSNYCSQFILVLKKLYEIVIILFNRKFEDYNWFMVIQFVSDKVLFLSIGMFNVKVFVFD